MKTGMKWFSAWLLFFLLLVVVCKCSAQDAMTVRRFPLRAPAAAGGSYPVPDILRWDMTDGSGTTVTAAVGPNGSTDASWISGPSTGGALDFNGSSQDGATASAITYGTNLITVAFPFWMDSTSGSQMIFESSPTVNSTGDTWYVLIDSGVLNVRIVDNSSGNRIETATLPSTAAWHHLLVVFDHSFTKGDCKVYIDGSVVSTSTVLDSADQVGAFSAQTLYVASRNRDSIWFDGRIGKVWIYSGDRSSDVSAIQSAQQ